MPVLLLQSHFPRLHVQIQNQVFVLYHAHEHAPLILGQPQMLNFILSYKGAHLFYQTMHKQNHAPFLLCQIHCHHYEQAIQQQFR